MLDLPTGTVTFLFADIEGSSRLLQRIGDRHTDVLKEYRQLLRAAMQEAGGREMDTLGDAFFAAFPRAQDALKAAVAAQRNFLAHAWPDGMAMRVRMGLHTGEPISAEVGYVGISVHRAAWICSVGHGGQILLSRVTHDLVEDTLPPGVGLRDVGRHRLKDLAPPQHLFQVIAAGLPSDFPALKSLDTRLHNLPIQLTSFIGREREKAEVHKILSTSRLLTLTGAGGAGKTRLALQVAAEVLEDFSDGVWFVEFASLSDSALVPHAVATAVNLQEQPGRPIFATLSGALRSKHLLLVLDNCEHLVAACARLSEGLLQACASLRILATSREALRVAGEVAWRVPSLSLPDSRDQSALNHFADYEAVRLFIERAAASRPGPTLTKHTIHAIVQICRQLDGIPLAIELAAALVSVLTVEQIASRLDDRFRILTGGSRTALPRHQTLGAAIDWSYNLLPEDERTLLQRMSVFAGGWTLEASEAVCSGDAIETADILGLLGHLVAKSMVVMETQDGEARYRLFETIRQYAQERLLEKGEASKMAERHRDWYLRLAEQAQSGRQGPQAAWLTRLEAEHDNLRAALEWSVSKGDVSSGLRLAAALGEFWYVHGHFTEGRRWLQSMLSRSRGASAATRAKALVGAASLAFRQSDYESSTALCQESLALFREVGDLSGMGGAHRMLGMIAMNKGDYAHANILMAESLALCRQAGDKRRMAIALNTIGEVARCQGDYTAARASYDASLALHREVGNKWGRAIALGNLGHVALYEHDIRQAAHLFREALVLARELMYRPGIAEYLAGLGAVAVEEGGLERAARLLGAAEALLGILGTQPSPPDLTEKERAIATVRAALGDSAFDAAGAEGKAMPVERVIEYALGEDDAQAPQS